MKENEKRLNVSRVEWEYEDQLPEMDDYDFDKIFYASKLREGVRMYPFVLNPETGERIWISWIYS